MKIFNTTVWILSFVSQILLGVGWNATLPGELRGVRVPEPCLSVRAFLQGCAPWGIMRYHDQLQRYIL